MWDEQAEIPEALIPDPAQYEVIHNTLDLERQLLTHVEFGETDKVRELFRKPAAGRPGRMARDGLPCETLKYAGAEPHQLMPAV